MIPQVTGRSVGGSSAFLLGAAATAVATILTYPLQIVQAKARVGMAVKGVEEKRAFLFSLYISLLKKDLENVGGNNKHS